MTHPSSAQLCVAVQFEGREGTRCMTFFNMNLVSWDSRVCRCSNASCRGFHKTCPLCDTHLRHSVRYNNLHFSTLYLAISYNEDNAKFLLTLFLEVFEKTCTSHYTSFCQLRQAPSQQPDTSRRANTRVFRLNPPFRCHYMN